MHDFKIIQEIYKMNRISFKSAHFGSTRIFLPLTVPVFFKIHINLYYLKDISLLEQVSSISTALLPIIPRTL